MKAAWEFVLEADSNSDECSVFGAARLPITSRCYSSSPDLWMRRAYNGYMYSQGHATGLTMDKIHPDDVVRVEFDGKAGTLSYSVNNGEMEVGFTDIVDTVYPACGSYRSGVQVRLTKVEVYGTASPDTAGSSGDVERSPRIVQWAVKDGLGINASDPSILASPPVKKDKTDKTTGLEGKAWLTARGDRGASEGVHDWSVELLEKSRYPLAVGVVIGGHPYKFDFLGGPCYTEMTKKQASTGAGGSAPSSSASSPTRRGAPLSSSRTQTPTPRSLLSLGISRLQSITATTDNSRRSGHLPTFGGPDTTESISVVGEDTTEIQRRALTDTRTDAAFQRLMRSSAPESRLRELAEAASDVHRRAISDSFAAAADRHSSSPSLPVRPASYTSPPGSYSPETLLASYVAPRRSLTTAPFSPTTASLHGGRGGGPSGPGANNYVRRGSLLGISPTIDPTTESAVAVQPISPVAGWSDSAGTERLTASERMRIGDVDGRASARIRRSSAETATSDDDSTTLHLSGSGAVSPSFPLDSHDSASVLDNAAAAILLLEGDGDRDTAAAKSSAALSSAALVKQNAGDASWMNRKRLFDYVEKGVTALSWHSDGSLWVNGEKRAEDFGKQFLPLSHLTSVTVRVDRSEQTVAYYVDGVFVGTAFGPEGSDAVVAVPLPVIDVTQGEKNIVYPAASVTLSIPSSTHPSQVCFTHLVINYDVLSRNPLPPTHTSYNLSHPTTYLRV